MTLGIGDDDGCGGSVKFKDINRTLDQVHLFIATLATVSNH
jgi:hypothetical protein